MKASAKWNAVKPISLSVLARSSGLAASKGKYHLNDVYIRVLFDYGHLAKHMWPISIKDPGSRNTFFFF